MAHAEMPQTRSSSGFGQRRIRPARAASSVRIRPQPAPQHAPRQQARKAARRSRPPQENRVHTAIVQGMIAGVLLLCLLHAASHFF